MISKGANLPNEDHVVRYVPWSRLRKDEDDNVIGFLPQAFSLREGEESLSLNWLEYFSGDRGQRIRNLVNELRRVRTVGAKSAYGVGNVGRIKEVCDGNGTRVRIVYEPLDDNLSHSELRRLQHEDMSLLDALATQAFSEMVRDADVNS
jgi:hypothetical protein